MTIFWLFKLRKLPRAFDLLRVVPTPWALAAHIIKSPREETSLTAKFFLVPLSLLLMPAVAIAVYTQFIIWILGSNLFYFIKRITDKNGPPMLAPGHTWDDLAEKFSVHPRQRREHAKRARRTVTTHRHFGGHPFPIELIGLVLDHLDVEKDTATLAACCLVCDCWLFPGRQILFRNLQASQGRAYTLHRLLRSPHSTIPLSHIKNVTLEDREGWDICDALFIQLMKLGVTPTRLYLRMEFPISIPPTHSTFCDQITHLTIDLAGSDVFEWRLSRLGAFLSAFKWLELLDIRAMVPCNTLSGIGTTSLSPHLKKFSFTCVGTVVMHPNIPGLVLEQTPKLEALHIGMSSWCSSDVSLLGPSLRIIGKHLGELHLIISAHIEGDGGPTMHVLQRLFAIVNSSSHPLPNLQALILELADGYSGDLDGSVVPWIISVARYSSKLTALSTHNFVLGEGPSDVLVQELGFICDTLPRQHYWRIADDAK